MTKERLHEIARLFTLAQNLTAFLLDAKYLSTESIKAFVSTLKTINQALMTQIEHLYKDVDY